MAYAITFFHVPGEREYQLGGQGQGGAYGGSIEGYVFLPDGANVTLHGVEGMFKVESSAFHVGHPDEDAGLHIFLKKVKSLPPMRGGRVTTR